jgi:hypothetical protein
MYVAGVMRWSAAGPDTSIAHVMEGISLFGVTPSLRAIPAGGFVIPAGHLTSEDSPVVEGALMPEGIQAQSLAESGSVVDLGHDAPLEDAGASAVDALAGSDHLENIGKSGFQLPFSSFSSWSVVCGRNSTSYGNFFL